MSVEVKKPSCKQAQQSIRLCRVCQSPNCGFISTLLSDPKQTNEDVLRYCEETFNEKFTRRSISNHRVKHMVGPAPLDDKAITEWKNQSTINERFDLGEVDEHDEVKTLQYLASKALQYIRMLEGAHPSQISHVHVQKYMAEVRECFKCLKSTGPSTDQNINISMVNVEVVGVLRVVADTVREVVPRERQQEFMEKLKSRIQKAEFSVVDQNNPMAPMLMGVSEVTGTLPQ